MGIVIFLEFFNSNSHSHSYTFFFGIAIPIPILILELGFHESTTELGQLLISVLKIILINSTFRTVPEKNKCHLKRV
jgi:hypothetical protein